MSAPPGSWKETQKLRGQEQKIPRPTESRFALSQNIRRDSCALRSWRTNCKRGGGLVLPRALVSPEAPSQQTAARVCHQQSDTTKVEAKGRQAEGEVEEVFVRRTGGWSRDTSRPSSLSDPPPTALTHVPPCSCHSRLMCLFGSQHGSASHRVSSWPPFQMPQIHLWL